MTHNSVDATIARYTTFNKAKILTTLMPRLLLLLFASLLFSGCATVSPQPEESNIDPWEGFNRGVYKFNEKFDRYLMKPVAKGYDKVVPGDVDRGITNFFSNLDDVLVILNDLFQLKFGQAAHDVSRFMWNSTVGVFGLFDVATPLGLEKHDEDFGQTLGYWGLEPGPYLVLPFFGPSNVRDGVGRLSDWQLDPTFNWFEPESTQWGLFVLDKVDARSDLLRTTRMLEAGALDPYVFTRDFYLQYRQNLVYDGNPPQTEQEQLEEDLFDSFDADPLEAPTTP